jgi:hypothetical protein
VKFVVSRAHSKVALLGPVQLNVAVVDDVAAGGLAVSTGAAGALGAETAMPVLADKAAAPRPTRAQRAFTVGVTVVSFVRAGWGALPGGRDSSESRPPRWRGAD